MRSAQELKKTLKEWENKFKEENQRKPKKDDIDDAPQEIRDAYREYTDLKKNHDQLNSAESGEQEKVTLVSRWKSSDVNKIDKFHDQDGDDSVADNDIPDVWGKEFDRKLDKSPSDSSETSANTTNKSSSYLQKLGSRMFDQALKLTNFPAGKSHAKKIFSRSAIFKPLEGDGTIVDQPETKVPKQQPVNKLTCMVDSNPENKEGKLDIPPDKPPPESDSDQLKLGGMFQKALLMTKRKNEKSSTQNSNVFIDKFSMKSRQKQKCLPDRLSNLVELHKQNLADDTCDFVHGGTDMVDGDVQSSSMFSFSSAMIPTASPSRKTAAHKESNEIEVNEDYCDTASATNKSEAFNRSELRNLKWPASVSSASVCDDKNKNDPDFDIDIEDCEDVVKPVRFAKDKRTRISRCNGKAVQETIISDEADDNDKPAGISEEEEEEGDEKPKGKKRKKAGKAPASKRMKANDGTVQIHDDDNENIAKTKPIKRAAPRDKPVSNDNFIRLNMKIKTYKRKGAAMTGPQYKRKMWKQKMQARSKSYGDACFKCGQSGHWANKCPGNKSKSDAWDKEPIMDEDFPSMQEAAMMARGIKLSPQQKQPVVKKTVTRENCDGTVSVDADSVAVDTDTISMETDSVAMEMDEELEVQAEVVRTRHEEDPPPPSMEPLLNAEEDGTIPDTPLNVMEGLKKFGYKSFRPGQEKAVMRILCGLSTLVVLSTGGGKSLCYQLPAYLYAQRSKCITLVVSPLVSLMEDQVTGLPAGVRGVCLHTNMTASQKDGVLAAVKDGKAQFLLVSPEAVAGGSMSLLAAMASLPPISFVCIDEAHCLSEWSHNFRPSYLRLCKVLQEKFGVSCFLGLTATATLSTAADVSRHLKITDFDQATVRGSPIPANLYLSVSRDENRDEAIVGLLKGERFSVCQSIIVYCTRRDQTDRVATLIRTCLNTGPPFQEEKKSRKKGRKLEWDAESYHAGLTPAQRKRVQNSFMAGRLRVVVATVAFGMGLDKSDVRGIIHYNMPKSFESYVQEIGRAGRDGKPAQCHVFLDPEGKDLCELRRHTFANTVDYRTLKRLVQSLFPACRCKDVHQKHAEALQATQDGHSDETGSLAEVRGQQGERICPGHERALPIEDTVMRLDVKEEGILTLLCYLELHSDKWLVNLSNVYAHCKIQCYGGPAQLQAIAKKCPPVAVAIAKARKDGRSFGKSNSIQFPVVEISDTMGWDSGPVKKELKLLQWNFSGIGGGPSRSGVIVEFTDLAFHFRSPGDLTIEELDDVLQFLHNRVQRQERSELRQLNRLYKALKSVSHRHHWMCSDELDISRNDRLKAILNDYFEHQTTERNEDEGEEVEDIQVPAFNQDQVLGDIRQFYSLYGQEHTFNGRAIARIFHGIASPCFPATTWGRVRRFWRSHLDVDFNELMKLATTELIRLK